MVAISAGGDPADDTPAISLDACIRVSRRFLAVGQRALAAIAVWRIDKLRNEVSLRPDRLVTHYIRVNCINGKGDAAQFRTIGMFPGGSLAANDTRDGQ